MDGYFQMQTTGDKIVQPKWGRKESRSRTLILDLTSRESMSRDEFVRVLGPHEVTDLVYRRGQPVSRPRWLERGRKEGRNKRT